MTNWEEKPVLELRNYVNHRVEVERTDKMKNIGWVYTIDPVTRTIVLYEELGEKAKLTTVFSHAICNIDIIEKPCDRINEIFRCLDNEKKDDLSDEEMEKRRGDLKNWLEKNRLPVQESGETLKIANALDIFPPYTPESCQSNNEVILSRVRNIIKSLPSTTS